jgi:hypothetical protein
MKYPPTCDKIILFCKMKKRSRTGYMGISNCTWYILQTTPLFKFFHHGRHLWSYHARYQLFECNVDNTNKFMMHQGDNKLPYYKKLITNKEVDMVCKLVNNTKHFNLDMDWFLIHAVMFHKYCLNMLVILRRE